MHAVTALAPSLLSHKAYDQLLGPKVSVMVILLVMLVVLVVVVTKMMLMTMCDDDV